LKTFDSYKSLNNELEKRKGSVGLVPTMGSLHEGHISLIKNAVKKSPNVIVSIFVNPTQFENKTDLKQYPKSLENDLCKLQNFNNILVYIPNIEELYPQGVVANKYNFGKIDKIMEGKYRANHFNGVATIVEKLFKIFKPNFAFFGEKDFQQLAIIKSLVKTKRIKTKIISSPTIRENDGLAMSSRNNFLKKEEREKAIFLHRSLLEAKELMNSANSKEVEKTITAKFKNIEGIELQYFKILTDDSFSKTKKSNGLEKYRAFIACIIGKVRLIDNMTLE